MNNNLAIGVDIVKSINCGFQYGIQEILNCLERSEDVNGITFRKLYLEMCKSGEKSFCISQNDIKRYLTALCILGIVKRHRQKGSVLYHLDRKPEYSKETDDLITCILTIMNELDSGLERKSVEDLMKKVTVSRNIFIKAVDLLISKKWAIENEGILRKNVIIHTHEKQQSD